MARRIFVDDDESSRSNPATLTRLDVFFSKVLSILMVVLFPGPVRPQEAEELASAYRKIDFRKGFTSPG